MENQPQQPIKKRFFTSASPEQSPLMFEVLKSYLENSLTQMIKDFNKVHQIFVNQLNEKGQTLDGFIANLKRAVAVGALASLFYILPGQTTFYSSPIHGPPHAPTAMAQADLALSLRSLLASVDSQPTAGQEKELAGLIRQLLGFSITGQLEGKRLNVNYGNIGAEQHLARYPGDNMTVHFDNDSARQEFTDSGMAPGRGAWGWWANSQSELTPGAIEQEKWYVAVQTFLSPGWDTNYREFYDWFRYRKVLVINPVTNRAVVAVVGDAGPATWTGKKFGGSPEVMAALRSQDGSAKGPVLIYFLDDHDDKIPLGPVRMPLSAPAQELAYTIQKRSNEK
ncbi:hypothetical protein HY388_00290 [Candidatus Daviesbacteria bacterium]|nr:hypothetical protein [Candidatus Daviesbacteria bacterium]